MKNVVRKVSAIKWSIDFLLISQYLKSQSRNDFAEWTSHKPSNC